jgi:hypothetical protein
VSQMSEQGHPGRAWPPPTVALGQLATHRLPTLRAETMSPTTGTFGPRTWTANDAVVSVAVATVAPSYSSNRTVAGWQRNVFGTVVGSAPPS